jgi:membrane-bound lytic murein transglycosylase D
MATPEDPSFALHLPKGTAATFSAEIADIPADKWVSWRRHRVESGETLTAIAKKYRVTPGAIAAANDLEAGTGLEAGEKLIIPAARPVEETKSRLVRYRVRRGDTLGGIADQFSVTDGDIRRWNGLKGGKVSRGMVLRIYTVGGAPETRTVKSSAKTRHKKPASAGGSNSGGQTKP